MGVWREIIYLPLHYHHQNDSCIKMGSDESHFNVSLIVRDKVTRQCPQTTTFKEKGEPKRTQTVVPLITSLTTYRWAKPAHWTVSYIDSWTACISYIRGGAGGGGGEFHGYTTLWEVLSADPVYNANLLLLLCVCSFCFGFVDFNNHSLSATTSSGEIRKSSRSDQSNDQRSTRINGRIGRPYWNRYT